MDEGRILTEAAIFADKVAVDEETVRLRSHVAQLRTMLQAERAHRPEAWTSSFRRSTASATPSAPSATTWPSPRTWWTMKAEVEKIREQVQNIE